MARLHARPDNESGPITRPKRIPKYVLFFFIKKLQRILQSGGANVHQYTLDHVVDFKEGDFLNLKITHIVADPVKAIKSEKFRGIIDVNKRK